MASLAALWLAFQEVPSSRTLVGGALVMAAVIADIIGDMGSKREPAASTPH